MATTNRYYGGSSLGEGRTIVDFSLCDLNGAYVFTGALRKKGTLVVAFFSPNGQASTNAVKAIQQRVADLGGDKLTAVGVAGPDRPTLKSYADTQAVSGVTILVDHDLHEPRNFGISHLPCTLVIDGKSGRVLCKV